MTASAPHSPRERLEHALHHAEHMLPAQRPLEAFVHHNTLHAFEEQTFEEAVVTAGHRFGAEAFMSIAAFREAWEEARVLDRDIDAALAARVPEDPIGVGLPGLTERELVKRLMMLLPADTSGPALQWRLSETEVLEEVPAWVPRDAEERLRGEGRVEHSLPTLWRAALARAGRPRPAVRRVRPRDIALRDRCSDPNLLVHPVLIRWCAAYLDHGQSYWPMPDRQRGFYRAMLGLIAQGGTPLRGWMRPLRAKARALLDAGTDPIGCALEVLGRLGVAESDLDEVVTATFLALPGWPGMFVQLAERPDLAPGPVRPTELADFLAIRLLLDEAALAAAEDESVAVRATDPVGAYAWKLFNAAQLVGLRPSDLVTPEALDRLVVLLDRWPTERLQALWQLAYERRYRIQIMDGVLNHYERIADQKPVRSTVQVVTCIDDREESFRRHLEELDPACETLGWAGFYGVAMAWRGLSEAHSRPLCPANVIPKHLVEEKVDPSALEDWDRHRSRRARSGQLGHATHVGSSTFFRGSFLSLTGLTAVVPMAIRLLAPSLHARLTHDRPDIRTVVTLEHVPGTPDDHGMQVGFKPEEMVAIVRGVLQGMGLTRDFAELVFILGHGSSSLNNPHEAAHDCGACGGGRGGPNGRIFAAMANRPDVRAALAAEGIVIPDGTWFIGGYHNPADDAVDLYDLHLVPEALQDRLAKARADIDEARRRDAHERCRRFDNAPLDLTFDEALRHVEDRSEDIAQPRPEYGHCTNAVCFVGRRSWSRGLYLDRRAFLNSYDGTQDPDGAILAKLLATVGPVGAGISLEYYFSFVDPNRYGCNTKLPHNVTGLVGVMDGHASDLRTGLPWQMVELHEPMRLLVLIEATPERLLEIVAAQPVLRQLIVNRWILVAAFDPETARAWYFDEQGFVPYEPESKELPTVRSSVDWYGGERGHRPPATILAGCPGARRSEGRAA